MRKIAAFVLAALVIFTLVGCGQTPAEPVSPDITSGTPDIGIALPEVSIPRWKRDGENIKKQLEAKGYIAELMYSVSGYSPTQESQIRELIKKGCKVLIIAAVDYSSLGSVLAEAKSAGITVIAYERQIFDTGNVDYYVSFDYFRYGALQGEYIEDALGLKDGKGPFNIEVFAGDLSDANMMFFFEGGMSILRPYIERGRLVVKSGQTDPMDVYTFCWKSENAEARMDELLAKYYTEDKLDAVFALNDSIAAGVIASLEDAGYTEFPVITGMEFIKPDVTAIKSGKQTMSVFPDSRILAAKAVEMVDAVMTGREVPLTAVTEHISGGRTFQVAIEGVPSFLCDPYVLTADNINEILIDGGYYTEADIE